MNIEQTEGYDPFEGYEDKSTGDRLKVLVSQWEQSEDDRQRGFFEGRMMEATIGMEEHPEWFQHGCSCNECLSCG